MLTAAQIETLRTSCCGTHYRQWYGEWRCFNCNENLTRDLWAVSKFMETGDLGYLYMGWPTLKHEPEILKDAQCIGCGKVFARVGKGTKTLCHTCHFSYTPQENKNKPVKKYVYKGEAKTLSQWADEYVLPRDVLYNRVVAHKHDMEKALTTPYKAFRKKSKASKEMLRAKKIILSR